MEIFRNYDFSARVLMQLLIDHEPAILTLGRTRVPAMYILPCEAWRETVLEHYGKDVEQKAKRLYSWTGPNGLNERNMIGLLVNQQLAILTLGGKDAAYLVPANEFWTAKVME